jgi:hypothetical protein
MRPKMRPIIELEETDNGVRLYWNVAHGLRTEFFGFSPLVRAPGESDNDFISRLLASSIEHEDLHGDNSGYDG